MKPVVAVLSPTNGSTPKLGGIQHATLRIDTDQQPFRLRTKGFGGDGRGIHTVSAPAHGPFSPTRLMVTWSLGRDSFFIQMQASLDRMVWNDHDWQMQWKKSALTEAIQVLVENEHRYL